MSHGLSQGHWGRLGGKAREIEAASSHTRVLSERTSQTGHSVRTPASGMCPSQGWECGPQEPA